MLQCARIFCCLNHVKLMHATFYFDCGSSVTLRALWCPPVTGVALCLETIW